MIDTTLAPAPVKSRTTALEKSKLSSTDDVGYSGNKKIIIWVIIGVVLLVLLIK
jgi:hypothetical protein